MSWKRLFWRPDEEGGPGQDGDAPAPVAPVAKSQPAATQRITAPAPASTPPVDLSSHELAAIIGAGATSASPPNLVAHVPEPVSAYPMAMPDDDIEDGDLLGAAPEVDDLARLEMFIKELDADTPPQVRVASANAFLRALGKDARTLLADTEAKIERIRGNSSQRSSELITALAVEQTAIDQLAARIETHRTRFSQLQAQHDALGALTAPDEERVRALRQFFNIV